MSSALHFQPYLFLCSKVINLDFVYLIIFSRSPKPIGVTPICKRHKVTFFFTFFECILDVWDPMPKPKPCLL